ncbi:MAG: diaminopimelate decarboxylase family protein, partial [Terriglobales bacterium]
EPGRAIVGPAGALLARVLYVKQNGRKRFLIVDAAMNDLLRPALYGAYHEIVPVVKARRPQKACDVVGPVCETGDFLALDRRLPELSPGDLVAILDAGAYGMAQASNYNTRPRPAEVLVHDTSARIIRQREKAADLMRLER